MEPTTSAQLFLVDGSSFLFRAYHQALNQDPRYNFRAADGLPTGAVRLFLTKMLQIVEKGAGGRRPTHAAVLFDVSRAGWRKDLYPAYKSSRTSPPDELKTQMPYMRHAVRSIGLHSVEMEGYEADDLIATYATMGAAAGMEVTVISADKDIMQLVGPRIRFFDFESGSPGRPGYRPERNYDEEGVREAWEGILPHQIPDAQALIGDSQDDIPGVKGFGLKTAAELIVGFGSIDAILANPDAVVQKKRRELIKENADIIRLSRALAKLDTEVPVPLGIDDLLLADRFDAEAAIAFAKALDLQAFVKRLAKASGLDANLIDPDPRFAVESTGTQVGFDRSAYSVTGDAHRLSGWLQMATKSGRVAVSPAMENGVLLGLGIATAPGQATYLPCGHEEEGTLFGGRYDGQMSESDLLGFMAALVGATDLRLIGYDIKSTWSALPLSDATSFDDVMLLSYAIDNGKAAHDIESLATRFMNRSYPLPNGSSKGLAPGDIGWVHAEQADIILRVQTCLLEGMSEQARRIYEDLELPLIRVLRRMERRGVMIDAVLLESLSDEFEARCKAFESEAHALAGYPFSISSPKQVGDLLFDRLGLPGGTRTPTGQWRTRASILEDLSLRGHRIAGAISDWRQISKLESGFVRPLRNARDRFGRVHTTFALAATPTARLASLEPNLQNIPIRTEDGRRIREAFVAAPGNLLISVDYSQIELRILAHIANVPQLRQAFQDGVDIHAMTASEVFGVSLENMSADIRRNAKAINFGIVYGISGFGLAAQLGIPVDEANEYIALYFSRFPGIKDYMVDVVSSLARNGYVENMFGRRIHYPSYERAKGPEKSAIERAAINAPIQSSAADLIRRAMIRLDTRLQAMNDANMLLQVHDELLFEVRSDLVPEASAIIKTEMEGAAAPDINISVPIIAEVGVAATWSEAH